ncbi:phasin family protein [Microvirga sp. BT689]|uniref:phasin family protein n=1 Tax=Microvirga arvi TaxID=2778731 RepID=UPI0019509EC8|nr:phasin family protein [Microvirga arvi]MBM6580815.1 phasin family protein [Microvirga arvi]
MTIVSTRSTLSDTMRSAQEFALSSGTNQALAKAAEAWFGATAECQREMIGFVSMRLEKDGDATREMMGCKNLADVAAIQSRWVEETLRDYNAETTKLMAICTKSVNGGARSKE